MQGFSSVQSNTQGGLAVWRRTVWSIRGPQDQLTKTETFEIGNHTRIRPFSAVIRPQSLHVPIQEHRECYLAHDPCSAADPPAKIMLDAPIPDCAYRFAGNAGCLCQRHPFVLVIRN